MATMLGGAAVAGASPRWVFALGSPQAEVITRSTWSMGTLINVSVAVEADDRSLFVEAFGALSNVDTKLSAHNAASELSLLNADAGEWRSASRAMIDVASAATRLGNLTSGALDVTVLPHLRRLGVMPSLGFNDQSGDTCDFTKLSVQNGSVQLATGGYAVDFGGIAKGYGVDEARRVLAGRGIRSALVEAGGDLVAVGRPSPDRRWRVGIRDPKNPAEICARLELEDESVATSGIYAPSSREAGNEKRHIVDPRTGATVDHVVSATVVAADTMTADALATAVSVMSRGEGQAFVESLAGVEAFWIYDDGDVFVTPGLRPRLELL